MKFARLFLISLGVCGAVSIISAYAMVRFLMNTVGTSGEMSFGSKTPPTPVVTTTAPNANLVSLESGVKSIASQVSPSVVSIVITREVQTYRTDPYGFFYEPAGTVRKKVGGGTGFFVSKE